jgi:BolA protein
MHLIPNTWMLWTIAKCTAVTQGFKKDGESHFRVKMVSAALAGQSRIAQHRAVHAAIGKQLMEEIHALALDLSIPN